MKTTISMLALFLVVGCTPASYPVNVTMKAAANTYSGAGKCRVRVEPLVFDAAATWAGKTEAEFVASLRPEAQQSHKGDLTGTQEAWFEQIKINERDYIGDKGLVSTQPGGNEPFVLASKVVAVAPDGGITVVHEVFAMPARTKVAEFTLAASNVGFGFGQRMRTSTIPQAMGMLSYFRDRFACNGPAAVVE